MTAYFRDRRSFVLLSIIPAIAVVLSAQNQSDWVANYNSGVESLNVARYPEAVRFLDAAAQQARDFPDGDLRRPRTKSVLATACQYTGEFDRAESLFNEARNALDASRPQDRALLAFTLDGLSQLRYERGRWAEAEELLLLALDPCIQSSGQHSLCAVTVRRHLGEVYAALGKSGEAEKILQQAVDISREAPSLPVSALASTLRSMGSVRLLQARYSLAKSLFEESLELSEKAKDDPSVADSVLGLGRMYRLEHETAHALPLLNRAARIYETSGDASLSTALHELGLALKDEGKFAMSRRYLERATDLLQQSRGTGHLTLAYLQVGIAETYVGERNYGEAAKHVQKAVEQEAAVLPDSHNELARAYLVAAMVEEHQHELVAADGHYRQALDIYRRSLTSDQWDLKRAEQLYQNFAKGYRK